MTTAGDVVIVGGGIVGCACAYELAKAGARATVLEYGKTGMQATNAAAGILSPLSESAGPGPMLSFGTRAMEEYPAVVEALEAEAGLSVEYRPIGLLRVAFDEADAAGLQRRYAWQREMGCDVAWLDRQMCLEMEPRLNADIVAGAFWPDAVSVSNQLVVLALARAAAARGAVIREGAPVRGFARKGSRVTAVRAGDESFACDTVVLAAGARSGQIAARLGATLPVRPIRGQMIALGGMVTPVRRIIGGPAGYIVPRANGLLFAGATVEDVGFRRRTTQAGLRSMRAMAIGLVPQLRAAAVHFSWAGLRPGTPDNMPIIGPLARPANVVAATGHFRQGIMLGPLTGRLVARGILAGDWTGVPPEFSPARFYAAS